MSGGLLNTYQCHSTWSDIGCMHAGTRNSFIKLHHLQQTQYKREKRTREVIHQKRQQAVFHLRSRSSGWKKQGTAKLFFVDQLWGCLGIRWDTALSLSGANILERATFIYTCCAFFTFLAVYFPNGFGPNIGWVSPPPDPTHQREKPKFTLPDAIHVPFATKP